ncbi:MAG: methyltransferase domain-containing protein, partial [Phycisphaerae bacterium]|nr:methyltransferase domain-containing protein [Phycisphaerae bacterium]
MVARFSLVGILALLLVVGPAACGDGGTATSKPPATPPSSPAVAAETPPASAPAKAEPAPTEVPLVSRPPIQVPRSKVPPAKTHYMGRRVAYTMHYAAANWLTRSTREKEENAALMLQSLKLKAGQTVCDLGCGNGYHTLRMAEMVGVTGKVYAVDIQVEMLEMLRKRAEKAKISNIVRIHNSFVDPGLPPASCDLILMVDVYHEFSHPEPMLAG